MIMSILVFIVFIVIIITVLIIITYAYITVIILIFKIIITSYTYSSSNQVPLSPKGEFQFREVTFTEVIVPFIHFFFLGNDSAIKLSPL